MIGQLRGTLAARLANNHVIVDCGGVGYEVACSGYTLAALPEVDLPVTLRVFTHAQENKIALYGFATAAERELFDHLITVKNVGPSTAMAILSGGAEPRTIAELIAKEDTAGLTKIKGVGKKTAELLVVELREKCELLLLSWNAAGAVSYTHLDVYKRQDRGLDGVHVDRGRLHVEEARVHARHAFHRRESVTPGDRHR